MGGLALVALFSLIDLPFRCPAILYTWVAVLAALPQICAPASPSTGHPEGWDGSRNVGTLRPPAIVQGALHGRKDA